MTHQYIHQNEYIHEHSHESQSLMPMVKSCVFATVKGLQHTVICIFTISIFVLMHISIKCVYVNCQMSVLRLNHRTQPFNHKMETASCHTQRFNNPFQGLTAYKTVCSPKYYKKIEYPPKK